MSGTVTTTTKVFPTDTPDVTPASDDRIMFSDTSDGGKMGDASINQIFSSPGPKTFTDDNIYHDVTGNTESPKMRRLAHRWKVKNNSDAGGVDRTLYVDADNSIVGNRKWVVYGYPKKTSDGTYGGYEDFFGLEFDTYDGNTTYTKKASFNVNKFEVAGYDLLSAWTNYTPARHSGITVSGFTVNSASYKQIGKTVFVQTYLAFTATSTDNTLNITLPKTVVSGKYFAGTTWIGGGASFSHHGYCDPDDTFHFETSFSSGTSYSIMFSATYETE